MCQLELYKTYLYSRSKDATIKDFKLEILICFNSSITKPPYTNTLYLPPFLYQIEQFFCRVLEALARWLEIFFELQKQQRNKCARIQHTLLGVLKCSDTTSLLLIENRLQIPRPCKTCKAMHRCRLSGLACSLLCTVLNRERVIGRCATWVFEQLRHRKCFKAVNHDKQQN